MNLRLRVGVVRLKVEVGGYCEKSRTTSVWFCFNQEAKTRGVRREQLGIFSQKEEPMKRMESGG